MEVLKRLHDRNASQGEVMKQVAQEHGVTLASSYYDYPGFHIYRWRKQLGK
jgi:hypothetical protein